MSRFKIRKKKIIVPIYKREIILLQAVNIKEALNHLRIIDCQDEDANAMFLTYEEFEKDKELYIIVDKKPSPSEIAHECYHASNYILNDIRAVPSFTNEEAQAYLISWLVDECYKFFKIYK